MLTKKVLHDAQSVLIFVSIEELEVILLGLKSLSKCSMRDQMINEVNQMIGNLIDVVNVSSI